MEPFFRILTVRTTELMCEALIEVACLGILNLLDPCSWITIFGLPSDGLLLIVACKIHTGDLNNNHLGS